MSEQQEMWEQPKGELSVQQMDAAVSLLRQYKTSYDSAKQESNDRYADYQNQQKLIASLLESAGKTEYICEGVGKIKISEQLSVTTPKSPEEKEAFFNWIKTNMGDEAYYAYMTVNSQSLNRLYREQTEEYGSRGEVLEINGLQPATTNTKVSFTRS